MSSHPAPAGGDGRTGYVRSLPQRIGAAKTNLVQARSTLKAAGRDIAAAQGRGRLDEAARLALELPGLRESIQVRQTQLAELEAERDGEA